MANTLDIPEGFEIENSPEGFVLDDIKINDDGTLYKPLEGKATKKSILRPLGNWFNDIGKGFVQGVSSLGVGLGKNIMNPLRSKIGKTPFTDEELNNIYGWLDDEPQSNTQKVARFVGETAPYMLLPEAKVLQGTSKLPTLENAAINGAYQGGIVGGVESLKNKGITNDFGKDAVIGTILGTGINSGLRGLPYAANYVVNSPFGQFTGRVFESGRKGLMESFALGDDVINRMLKSPRGTELSRKADYFGDNKFINDVAKRLNQGVNELRQQETTKFAQARDGLLNNNQNTTINLSNWNNDVKQELRDLGFINSEGLVTPSGQRATGLNQFLNDLNYYNGNIDLRDLQSLKSNVLDDIINYSPMAGQNLNNSTRSLQNVAKNARRNINELLGETLGEEYREANKQLSNVLNTMDNVPEIKDLTNAQNIDTLANKLKRVGTIRTEAQKGLQNLENIMNENGINISQYGLNNDIQDFIAAREIKNRIRTGADAQFRNIPRRALVQPVTEFYIDRALPLYQNTLRPIAGNINNFVKTNYSTLQKMLPASAYNLFNPDRFPAQTILDNTEIPEGFELDYGY